MEGDRCGLHSGLVTSCIWRGGVGDRAIPEDVAQVGSDDSGTPFLPTVTVFISVPPAPTSLVPRFPGLFPASCSCRLIISTFLLVFLLPFLLHLLPVLPSDSSGSRWLSCCISVLLTPHACVSFVCFSFSIFPSFCILFFTFHDLILPFFCPIQPARDSLLHLDHVSSFLYLELSSTKALTFLPIIWVLSAGMRLEWLTMITKSVTTALF